MDLNIELLPDVDGYTAYTTRGCYGQDDLFAGTVGRFSDCADMCSDDVLCKSLVYERGGTYFCALSSTCVSSANTPDDSYVLYVKSADPFLLAVRGTPYDGYPTGGCLSHNELGAFPNTSVQDCEKKCSSNEDCISFEYAKDGTTCRLSSSCIYRDTMKNPDDPFYFYQNQKRTWSTYFDGYNNGGCTIPDLGVYNDVGDISECATKCLEDPKCLSFWYHKAQGQRKLQWTPDTIPGPWWDGYPDCSDDDPACPDPACKLSVCTLADTVERPGDPYFFFEKKVEYESRKLQDSDGGVDVATPFNCRAVVDFMKAKQDYPFFVDLDKKYRNDLGGVRFEPVETDDGTCKVKVTMPPDPHNVDPDEDVACEFEATVLELFEKHDTLAKLKKNHPNVFQWVNDIVPSLDTRCGTHKKPHKSKKAKSAKKAKKKRKSTKGDKDVMSKNNKPSKKNGDIFV